MSLRMCMYRGKTTPPKFGLDPVRLESSGGFRRTETNRILRIVEENRLALVEGWNDHFRD